MNRLWAFRAAKTSCNSTFLSFFSDFLPWFSSNRGKRSVVLNLKSAHHIEILKKMITGSDVLIDPFRPGVLEKMGLSPEECFKINKRIVICRLTGYGQTGPLALKAGHDLNYLANAGVLGGFGRKGGVPGFPNNILVLFVLIVRVYEWKADFMGGGAMAAFGVLTALYERNRTGKGQVFKIHIFE